MTAPHPASLRDVLEELANALQVAVGLSAELRRRAATEAEDLAALDQAIVRAVIALRLLRPPWATDDRSGQ